jgi:ferric-dicitrate binding protein FerR (iron transport regulator)
VLRLPLAAGDADAALVIVSTADGPALKVQMGGTKVTVQDADPAVQIDVADGSATVEIAGSGALEVKSGGNVKLEASGNIDIEAGGTLTLKGATVNIN